AAFDPRHDGCRDTTGGRAHLDRACKLCPGLHAQLLQHRSIVVERVPGQEEANGFVFPTQTLRRQPSFDLWQRDLLACRTPAEQFVLADSRSVVSALRTGKHRINSSKRARAVFVEYIERPGCGKTFEQPFVHRSRIDARREVREIREYAVLSPCDDRLDRLPANAFECGERVYDRIALDFEIYRRAIDRGRVDADTKPLGFCTELGELVGIA